MQLRRMMGLLVACVSVGSLMFSGCTQQREFEEESQAPAFTVQTQATALNRYCRQLSCTSIELREARHSP